MLASYVPVSHIILSIVCESTSENGYLFNQFAKRSILVSHGHDRQATLTSDTYQASLS